MNSGINTLNPLSINRASVAACGCVVGFTVLHWFVAWSALCACACGTVRFAIWNTLCSVIHKCVRAQYEFDFPISVGSVEQQFFETSVLRNIFFFDKDWTFILHVSWWAALVLIIVTIVFDSETRGRYDPITTNWHLFGIIWGPDLNFWNVAWRQTCSRHFLVKTSGVLIITSLALK